MELTNPITCLFGVGEQRAILLRRLGIETVEDILLHYPRSYLDLTHPVDMWEAINQDFCPVKAEVVRKIGTVRITGGKHIYKALAGDSSGTFEVRFFNNRFALERLKEGNSYLFYGKMERFGGNYLMNAPQVFPAGAYTFAPCYPLTKGLTHRILSNLARQSLPAAKALPEVLPEKLRNAYGLMGIADAIQAIHFPQDVQALTQARRRLMFEELFTLATGVGMLRLRTHAATAIPLSPADINVFYRVLPFSPTNAQRRAIEELTADMCRPIPANRLIQGDVGSGKTIVAAAGAWYAYCSGKQSALMAPTELLAHQHFENLSLLLEKLGMRVALLTGSMTSSKKREVREALRAGTVDLCIGTHALLSKGVDFADLALVITDEQHRFGVEQRCALTKKGASPHTLVMSATPIPRTLALMIYGELDLSVIDELPPGRKPIKTYKISSPKRARAFGYIQEHLRRGYQAYIVCPLVEADQETPPGLRDATAYVEELREAAFADFQVGLLHGRMKASEKEKTMSAFQRGEIQLLVSTTVIEVGVDVPNAVIMMIENAERFGLSQLHQLRGRVGRGTADSCCILLSDTKSPETLARLRMMCDSNDGFQIAEYDLQTRGPGNFFGRQQHGLPSMKIADLTTDTHLVVQAQEASQWLLREDPGLQAPDHAYLRQHVEAMMRSVGNRPN